MDATHNKNIGIKSAIFRCIFPIHAATFDANQFDVSCQAMPSVNMIVWQMLILVAHFLYPLYCGVFFVHLSGMIAFALFSFHIAGHLAFIVIAPLSTQKYTAHNKQVGECTKRFIFKFIRNAFGRECGKRASKSEQEQAQTAAFCHIFFYCTCRCHRWQLRKFIILLHKMHSPKHRWLHVFHLFDQTFYIQLSTVYAGAYILL